MVRCWASSLGDCIDQKSGEHYVSKTVFTGEVVTVMGFPWCPPPHGRQIPVETFKSNILCKRHNEQLSPVDAEGGRAMRIFLEWPASVAAGGGAPVLDGRRLERWFLKTTVNFFMKAKGDWRWQLTGQHFSEVPEALVRAAFGCAELVHPMGLYYAAKLERHVAVANRVGFWALFSGRMLAASAFIFGGHAFVVWLTPVPPPRKVPREWKVPPGVEGAVLMRHPSGFLIESEGGGRGDGLRFAWR